MKRTPFMMILFSLVLSVLPIHSVVQANTSSMALIPVVVTKNTDGDTIHVKMPNGTQETIRMLLIDTPESVDPYKPVEPYGSEASHYAKQVLPVGKHILIEEGVPGHTRDKYGRLLAFVYLTPKDMYNEDVVKLGFARVAYIYPPNTQHLAALQQDESSAKAHHLRIWSIPGYVTSTGYNVNAKHESQVKTATMSKTIQPKQTTGSAGLRVLSTNLVVSDGQNASVTVQTKPGATGSILVDYKSGPSHAKGLGPQTADPDGRMTWTWDVGSRTTHGNWPVIISVNGKTIQLKLQVR